MTVDEASFSQVFNQPFSVLTVILSSAPSMLLPRLLQPAATRCLRVQSMMPEGFLVRSSISRPALPAIKLDGKST